ncbi:pyridine nucleotide-disulfide oxidoreductase, putative [Phytophthora infestans T30-4]|uniref:Pyridine nucleotide-disulphide oxidoreductase, putative n=1 Tax=Phytophthora infestans (strain T30-4) TaxID=403677 RepID=D0N1T8_PHYIT|nr:pyridine nucleotide-disulfide oxidoreductase, putative [Phytophthora infestans T30-4]EEY68267.1 pyridine nucleotide-disulphide oxidoreductase, putative [Phytophthora infestans T30-4]|eukprot:XP_002905426.1 pyridine nucleotide-disulphide oxidoreductase, putative [Phytophthora infestans T30-4]
MTRVVIVGGGAAGINTAQALAKNLTEDDDAEVVVLEKNAHFYHVVGAPRAYVDADYTNKMFIPYDNAIPKHAAKFVRIVRGVATHISADTNEVSYHAIDSNDKESEATSKLKFDYLVLATGSSYSVPIKPDSRDHARSATEAKLQEVRGHIEKAERILVVGGGAVGCEVAAEIKSKYPKKSVTIVDANKQLIAGNNLRDKFYSYLNASMEKLGVKVIVGERLTERLSSNGFETRTLRTDQGTEITSDIQLLCGGFSPVAALVKEMDASLVTERGSVKVNDNLQLEGEKYAHIFALGDVCNHPAPKMAFIAGEQGKFLAGELAAVIQKKQTEFMKPFDTPAVPAMILPLGPRGGVSQLPFWGGVVVGDWFTWLLKSRDYFAGRIWASIGATVPSN